MCHSTSIFHVCIIILFSGKFLARISQKLYLYYDIFWISVGEFQYEFIDTENFKNYHVNLHDLQHGNSQYLRIQTLLTSQEPHDELSVSMDLYWSPLIENHNQQECAFSSEHCLCNDILFLQSRLQGHFKVGVHENPPKWQAWYWRWHRIYLNVQASRQFLMIMLCRYS